MSYELQVGEEWRLFSSDLSNHDPKISETGYVRFNSGISHSIEITQDDCIKLCSMMDKVLKNLFNIEYKSIDNIDSNDFTIDIIRPEFYNPSYRKREISIGIVDARFRLFFNFLFDFDPIKFENSDNYYVLRSCLFNLEFDDYLQERLPIHTDYTFFHCEAIFKINQAYQLSELNQVMCICHYTPSNLVDQYKSPTVSYKYIISPLNTDVKISYQLKENFAGEFDKSFVYEIISINPNIEDKLRHWIKIFDIFYEEGQVTTFFPQFNEKILTSAASTKKVLDSFLNSEDDISHEMAMLEIISI